MMHSVNAVVGTGRLAPGPRRPPLEEQSRQSGTLGLKLSKTPTLASCIV
jgi:hypothetical protein